MKVRSCGTRKEERGEGREGGVGFTVTEEGDKEEEDKDKEGGIIRGMEKQGSKGRMEKEGKGDEGPDGGRKLNS